jgi:hypothetical protein
MANRNVYLVLSDRKASFSFFTPQSVQVTRCM